VQRGDSEWPATAWTLTAPESFVLQEGPNASGSETFKVAVLELVSRGALRLVEVEERGAFGRVKRTSVLAPGPKPRPPTAQPLAAVWLLYSGVPLKTFPGGVVGVAVEDFARAAVRRYRSLDRYRFEEVVSSLVDRGLFAREQYRVLWLFPAQRVVVTPAGERARADLERRLALGREQFGDWVDRDPARALAFVGLAGASVLLMNPLYPEFQRLRQQLGAGPTTSAGDAAMGATYVGPYGSGDDRPSTPEEAPGDPASIDPAASGLNIGGLDLSGLNLEGIDLSNLSFDFDLSAFDSLGSAFDAIDAGVDSGGGDSGGGSDSGGGDSGGGDGGGGGSGE
jgi:uncharacterized membrane protein YgcG